MYLGENKHNSGAANIATITNQDQLSNLAFSNNINWQVLPQGVLSYTNYDPDLKDNLVLLEVMSNENANFHAPEITYNQLGHHDTWTSMHTNRHT